MQARWLVMLLLFAPLGCEKRYSSMADYPSDPGALCELLGHREDGVRYGAAKKLAQLDRRAAESLRRFPGAASAAGLVAELQRPKESLAIQLAAVQSLQKLLVPGGGLSAVERQRFIRELRSALAQNGAHINPQVR